MIILNKQREAKIRLSVQKHQNCRLGEMLRVSCAVKRQTVFQKMFFDCSIQLNIRLSPLIGYKNVSNKYGYPFLIVKSFFGHSQIVFRGVVEVYGA